MENLGTMVATLPDYEDDVPMSDEEREVQATIAPTAAPPTETIKVTATEAAPPALEVGPAEINKTHSAAPEVKNVITPRISDNIRK